MTVRDLDTAFTSHCQHITPEGVVVDDHGILITGASGTLGSRLVRSLAAHGVQPRALVRTREKADQVAPFATPINGDLLAPKSLEAAFRDVERVFILGQPTADMEVLERNAIDAAVAAGVRRIVYMSNFTALVGSALRPNHIHGVHEGLIASLGIEWTVLGPTRYMTNMPFDWPSVLQDSLLHEGGGGGTMTCIDPDDVAAIAAKVLTEEGHHGQTYKLTSNDAFTAAELAELLGARIGHVVTVADDTPIGGYFELVAAGSYHTTDTAERLLGRVPRAYAHWLDEHLPRIRSELKPS